MILMLSLNSTSYIIVTTAITLVVPTEFRSAAHTFQKYELGPADVFVLSVSSPTLTLRHAKGRNLKSIPSDRNYHSDHSKLHTIDGYLPCSYSISCYCGGRTTKNTNCENRCTSSFRLNIKRYRNVCIMHLIFGI